MRSAELPYAPLAPGAMDGELRAALAAVQRFRGDMEAANAVEQGGKDHQYYEVRRSTCSESCICSSALEAAELLKTSVACNVS